MSKKPFVFSKVLEEREERILKSLSPGNVVVNPPPSTDWLEKVVIGLICLFIGLFSGWYMRENTKPGMAAWMKMQDKTAEAYYDAYYKAAFRTRANTERQMGKPFGKGDYVSNTYWFLINSLKHPCQMPEAEVEKFTNQVMLLSIASIQGEQETEAKEKEDKPGGKK